MDSKPIVDLDLPCPRVPLPASRALAPEEYLQWVLWLLREVIDLEAARADPNRRPVEARFEL